VPAYFTAGNQVAQLISPFIQASGAIDGTITSTVFRDPGTGFLGFQYFWDRSSATGDSVLIRSTIGDLSNPWLGVDIFDAGSDSSGSSTPGSVAPVWADGAPNFILRDPVANGAGITVQWRAMSQGTALEEGDYSALIFLQTRSTFFAPTNVGLLDSGAVSHAQALAPAIPEPLTLTGMLIAAGGLTRYIRRRRSR